MSSGVMLDEGIRADFELTVTRQIAKWKRGEAVVDVNPEALARASPQVLLDCWWSGRTLT